MNSKKKILCIVRIGNNQVCANWMFDRALLESMTLVVSSYQPLTFSVPDHPSITHHEFKGGKWEGIFDYFKKNPNALKEYDYYFFPDDDIETTSENIQKFFAITEKFNLKLAQPALKPDSYFSHILTVQRNIFTVRHTNFVELMIPFMSQSVLEKSLPFFESTKYGWGLDHIWAQFADNPDRDVAIVDASPVGHYRPLASQNNQTTATQAAQHLMSQEYENFEKNYDLRSGDFTIKSAFVNDKVQIKNKLIITILNLVSIYNSKKSPQYSKVKMAIKISRKEIKTTKDGCKFNKSKIDDKIFEFYRENNNLIKN